MSFTCSQRCCSLPDGSIKRDGAGHTGHADRARQAHRGQCPEQHRGRPGPGERRQGRCPYACHRNAAVVGRFAYRPVVFGEILTRTNGNGGGGGGGGADYI